MSSLVRLTTAINKVSTANPADCLAEIRQLLDDFPHEGSDILLLPRYALCSPECGSLLQNGIITRTCQQALDGLRKHTKVLDGYLIAGLVTELYGTAISAMAVLHRGELLALIPCSDKPGDRNFSADQIFACGSLRFGVLSGSLETLAFEAARAAALGCDLILMPAYHPVFAGSVAAMREEIRVLSNALGCAIAVVNGGVGGSSSPYLYQGFACIAECGQELAFLQADTESCAITADLDLDVITALRRTNNPSMPVHEIPLVYPKPGLKRPLSRTPFLPTEGKDAYLAELFDYQARSLAIRIQNIGVNHLVVGVSGGIDSTATLLVAIAACEKLGLPRENVHGITMPGLGTSDHTYFNALALLEELGVSRRDISIRPAVLQHFEDIGHSGLTTDTAYENAQARERTQILFDLANMLNAIMVGSGDLSEGALGFCTFGGDHLANYNVNVCITKTVLRELLAHLATHAENPAVASLIREVLDTPVSPELLPLSENGEIAQKTEEILGPYELHDFFLYYFIRYHMRPSRIYHYACIAFAGKLSAAFIRDKLALFIRKFCAGQFKRACAPDAASITQVNLLGVNYSIPSDLDPSVLLADLKQVET